jgi:hypothetical protein
MRFTPFIIIASLFIVLPGCSFFRESESEKYQEEKAKAPFAAAVSLGKISDKRLDEVSGIVASHTYPGYYWVHNDSGGEPNLYLIDSTAKLVGQVKLAGIENRDWEDVALAPGTNGRDVLYIAETGDNSAQDGTYFIYTLEEPALDSLVNSEIIVVNDFSTYTFRYPDGARDAETLLVDPLTLDFIIVTKREDNVGVYFWAAPQSSSDVFKLEKSLTIPFWMVVGGDISRDGSELVLKDYESVFYWKKNPETSWIDALKTNPHRLPYQPEPQGEAIAFTADGDGYVTLSERKRLSEQHLYFYSRK